MKRGAEVSQAQAAPSSVRRIALMPWSIIVAIAGAMSCGSRSAIHTRRQRPSPSVNTCTEALWCAADRNKAFSDAKAGADPKTAKCDNPVTEEFELGQRVGINGTPTVIAPDGTQIGGYLPPEAMRQRLDALATTTK